MCAFSPDKDLREQSRAPIYEALQEYKASRIVSFDVPGHKQGRGNAPLTDFLGKDCLSVDVNSMKPLDNLCHPVSVIREAEVLAAEAFGAAHAFFIVIGTLAAVQAMFMSVCHPGDEIILPRNVHRSAISALVLCGAIPIYVNPGVDVELGIPLGMALSDVEIAIRTHPNAKAIMVNNPTYYGICSNLPAIVLLAHRYGMKVLVDEAHGTHFSFHDSLPPSAMACGADMASISMHKTGGSLTQSSFLLAGKNERAGYIRQILNLTQTTSASYLLMASLDLSRRNLALNGKEIFGKVLSLSQYAREEINRLGGFYAFAKERINEDTIFAFDTTKLSVFTRPIGLAGIEVYDLLRDEYGIQVEFGDLGNFLAMISVGDREREIERLISALAEIKRRFSRDPAGLFDHEYIHPQVVMTPQEAFYAENYSIPLQACKDHVCAESIMCYPPGIPIVAPGEKITQEIVDYILYSKEKGCFLTGTIDPDVREIRVVK